MNSESDGVFITNGASYEVVTKSLEDEHCILTMRVGTHLVELRLPQEVFHTVKEGDFIPLTAEDPTSN